MALESIPLVVTDSGDAADAPSGAIPTKLYGGASGGGAVDSVNGKSGAVVLTATDVEALPDTYEPSWAVVTGKPSTFPPTVGTTGTTAAAGNHNHSVAADAGSGLAAAATIQAFAVAVSTRIAALEAEVETLKNP